MRRSGMRGINTILITGRLLNKSIPIGADIALVSVMTRIFIISTIVARGKVGIKDSMASVLLEPLLVMASVPPGAPGPGVRPLEPLVLASVPLEPLVLASIREPLVLASDPWSHWSWRRVLAPLAADRTPGSCWSLASLADRGPASPEPQVLASVPLEPLVLAFSPWNRWSGIAPGAPALASVNLKNLLVVKKNRSSSSPTGASSQIAPPGRSGIILRGKSRFPRFDH